MGDVVEEDRRFLRVLVVLITKTSNFCLHVSSRYI